MRIGLSGHLRRLAEEGFVIAAKESEAEMALILAESGDFNLHQVEAEPSWALLGQSGSGFGLD